MEGEPLIFLIFFGTVGLIFGVIKLIDLINRFRHRRNHEIIDG